MRLTLYLHQCKFGYWFAWKPIGRSYQVWSTGDGKVKDAKRNAQKTIDRVMGPCTRARFVMKQLSDDRVNFYVETFVQEEKE